MSIFGLYFTQNMLIQMKWPRKQGIFGKQVIDATVFDYTVFQMIDWAAALGAGYPELSLQIIAYMFKDKDWNSPDRPKVKQLIEELNQDYKDRKLNLEKTSPHDVIKPAKIADHFGSNIDAKMLKDKRIIDKLEKDFLYGLIYGLGNSSSYESWYKNYIKDANSKIPEWKKIGLDIGADRLPSLSESYINSEQIIRAYEKSLEITLPSIPETLLSDARDLGIVGPIDGIKPKRTNLITKSFFEAMKIYKQDLGKSWDNDFVIPIGFDEDDNCRYHNLSEDPAILMAGATGSGKSNMSQVCICSLLQRFKPEDIKLLLVDCKRVEYSGYKYSSYLFSPVAFCNEEDSIVFSKLEQEIEKRKKQNIKRPYIFVVIDEFSDIAAFNITLLENIVEKISKFGSETGIGLIMYTSRPATDVITRTIKSSIKTKLGLATASEIDSRTLMDRPGCEKLLGKGDGLYLPYNSSEPIHIQVPLITYDEIQEIIKVI